MTLNDQKNLERAFPIQASELCGSVEPSSGMTLRDYFAAKALQGLVLLIGIPVDGRDELWDGETAKRAYALADAMLAERKKCQ